MKLSLCPQPLYSMTMEEGEGGLRALELGLSNWASTREGGAEPAFDDGSVIRLGAEIEIYSGEVDRPRELFRGVITAIEQAYTRGEPPLIRVCAEDALLVLLLSAMIVLAATQIMLRNFFDSGFVWIDPLLRVLVLWLGLIGATVATRNNRHIRIDLLSRFFSRNVHRLIQSIIGQVSAWTCLVIAWYGFKWIQMDYVDGITSFLVV